MLLKAFTLICNQDELKLLYGDIKLFVLVELKRSLLAYKILHTSHCFKIILCFYHLLSKAVAKPYSKDQVDWKGWYDD